jgi:hypothetical protein
MSRPRFRSRSRSPPQELPHSAYAERAPSPPHDPDAWRHVKPFYRRRPIRFIPAGSTPSTFSRAAPAQKSDGSDVARRYLELVGLSRSVTPAASGATTPATQDATSTTTTRTCETCGLEYTGTTSEHERTLAHQSSLPHSHPPHSLPRSSVGLKILQSSGWDPDAREGLGPAGEGPRYPIKAVEKHDRRGVGVEMGKAGTVEKVSREKLDAKKTRRLEGKRKKKREEIMRELTGDGRLELLLHEEGKMEGL